MSDRNQVQPGVRISSSVWNEFRQDIQQRKGMVRGHLKSEVENALEAYIDGSHGGDTNDRLRRIENHVESIRDELDSQSDDTRKKKKDSSVTSRTKKLLEAIGDQIHREAGDASTVHVSVVNQAIEDNAGSSRPTLERYKEMLKQRHYAFENPSEQSESWFLDGDVFVQVVESNFPQKTNDIATEYGKEWYDETVSEIRDEEPEVGFA